MSKHHLIFGGTIRWEKTGPDKLSIQLEKHYATRVTVHLGKETILNMLETFEPPESAAARIKRIFGKEAGQ